MAKAAPFGITRKEVIGPGDRVLVYADGVERPDVTALTVTRSAGGAMGDYCRLRSNQTEFLVDGAVEVPIRTIMVVVRSPDAKRQKTIFWGQTSGVFWQIGDEQVEFEARVARFLFGPPLLDYSGYDAGGLLFVAEPIVFNPLIDGQLRGNKFPDDTGATYYGFSFFEWESARSEWARVQLRMKATSDRKFDEAEPKRQWKLWECVLYLCKALTHRGDKSFIEPVQEDEVRAFFDTEDAPPIRNVRIPIGAYLPEALDMLLGPLGYGWFLDADQPERPKLTFFRRGTGTERKLWLQRPGERFDPQKNNTPAGRLSVGVQATINQVILNGKRVQFETSVICRPAWTSQDEVDEDFEPLAEDLFAKDSESYAENPDRRRVFRDFVANESRDYGELDWMQFKDELQELDESAPKDKDAKHVILKPPERRLRPYPCLTRNADGTPVGDRGYAIRWRENENAQWKELEELPGAGDVQILDQEIGVRFNGNLPPPEIMAAGRDAQIELTATFEPYCRFACGVEAEPGESLQTNRATTVIDCGDRFALRLRSKRSRFYPRDPAPGGGSIGGAATQPNLPADEADDREAMAAYARHMLTAWNQADVSGSFELIGFGLEGDDYQIGEVLTAIEGRELRFHARTDKAKEQRYPQLVAIEYDLLRQARLIEVQTMRDAEIVG